MEEKCLGNSQLKDYKTIATQYDVPVENVQIDASNV